MMGVITADVGDVVGCSVDSDMKKRKEGDDVVVVDYDEWKMTMLRAIVVPHPTVLV